MHTPRVSYGKPHTSGRGWHITLDCGHSVYMSIAPVVGALCPCTACKRIEEREQEARQRFAKYRRSRYAFQRSQPRHLEERDMNILGRQVTVCGVCERACCWQGEFMCDGADMAGTKQQTVRDLHTKPRGEHAEYWFKDPATGEINQDDLEEFRANRPGFDKRCTLDCRTNGHGTFYHSDKCPVL